MDTPSPSPFHAGERMLQERAGVRDWIEQSGRRGIRDHMPDQHRELFGRLPFMILGALDGQGWPRATLLAGAPGFVQSPDARTLVLGAQPVPGDPLHGRLVAGAEVGLLGIQLETRRRNRMNGRIAHADAGGFTVQVGQSFGNCPQYIQAREPVPTGRPPRPVVRAEGARLSAAARALVARADTFFLATAAPAGVDVSHRGGAPGFVRVDEEDGRTVLTAPDFRGNFFFNSFGNLALNPRSGLLFVDFATGGLLSLAGEAEVVWSGPELEGFAGAERLLRVRLTGGVFLEDAVPLRWSAPQPAPELARLGDWQAAALARDAADTAQERPFTVTRIVDECATIRSFILEPAEGRVAPHKPGQHLPLLLPVPGREAPLRRRYTLSDAPDGRSYRITVKRDGVGSAWLHDAVRVGDTLRAGPPQGGFTLDPDSRRPVLLLSAGVGVTPMIALLNDLMGASGERVRHPGRPVLFIHGARDGGQHAFGGHVRALAARRPTLTVHVRYSAPRAEDVPGRDHDSAGRIDAALLGRLLPDGEPDVYLCGPPGFMQEQYDALLALGVPDARIHAEAFGPASLRRRPAAGVAGARVEFRRSGTTRTWRPERGTLLDLAEAAGLPAASDCRSGTCGTCAVRLAAGAVRYAGPVTAPAGMVLVCSAVPATERLVLDL
ncbi:pyridoxamine 5'-phosphate oxidase family protein [Azospirillum sp. ST 5-10]|uniref:pyridoxamine 5'-phosphate oxidase family protein n=1 Tax=unclassified Azospirillum TaxID=2630922 RepID=UPI003F49BDD9